mmetsp:Transcript_14968/g.21906  ORF Transcript_14968/g.21906 Transcript_14968/m.21906 type:complete len:90 (-) Transcript_14968:965-1234(-)
MQSHVPGSISLYFVTAMSVTCTSSTTRERVRIFGKFSAVFAPLYQTKNKKWKEGWKEGRMNESIDESIYRSILFKGSSGYQIHAHDEQE